MSAKKTIESVKKDLNNYWAAAQDDGNKHFHLDGRLENRNLLAGQVAAAAKYVANHATDNLVTRVMSGSTTPLAAKISDAIVKILEEEASK